VGAATEPLPNGYQLTVTCSCGVVFIRWMTLGEAAEDLAILMRRA
jgi:hypothetical protein